MIKNLIFFKGREIIMERDGKTIKNFIISKRERYREMINNLKILKRERNQDKINERERKRGREKSG